ncbi:aldehyde dehydrogenase family protein [Advenella kashmirensis]
MSDFSLLIAGQLCAGDNPVVPVVNPATEQVCAHAPAASAQQLDAAISAASHAFDIWRHVPMAIRRDHIDTMADTIEENAEELARILALETGKPPAAARAEVDGTVMYFKYFVTLSIEPKLLEESSLRRVEIYREPLGVVAAIIPWNFPLLLLAFKVPAALLTGNTVIVKPATTTPLTTLLLGRLLVNKLPSGVLNILSGDDDLGPWLTIHPGIRKISFTGSTQTGKRVMASAARNLARVTLELGGNDPAIILKDVDVARTAKLIFASAFGNSGQVCRAIKRVYAHAAVYEELCAALSELARQAVVGDGSTGFVDFGPVQNRAQFQRLKQLLEDAHTHGTVLPGGGLLDSPGYFMRPTIVKDVAPDSRIVREEQFGPILPVMKFTDIDDAIAQANASEYGLAASVWSADLQRGQDIATRLDAGTVWINKHIDRTPHLPVAGARHSGLGVELGVEGLYEFTQIKVINASSPA